MIVVAYNIYKHKISTRRLSTHKIKSSPKVAHELVMTIPGDVAKGLNQVYASRREY